MRLGGYYLYALGPTKGPQFNRFEPKLVEVIVDAPKHAKQSLTRTTKMMKRLFMIALGVAASFWSLALATPIEREQVQKLDPDKIAQLKQKGRSAAQVDRTSDDRPTHLRRRAYVDPSLADDGSSTPDSRRHVVVKLKTPPAAEKAALARVSHKQVVKREQTTFLDRNGLSSHVISSIQTLSNAIFLNIDASQVESLANDPDVVSIKRVSNYELHLDETVPYIGATAAQTQGYTGNGVKVAVLDSGIDYTHAAFGGEGTIEGFYKAYDDNTRRDGLFPTAKVVDGIDFVGEAWPGGDIAPDNDPIDGQGHGTAVADIINSVAPGVLLYAVRVCARLAQSCYGAALMQGLEWAVEQGVDIVNLSIGSPYGTPFDHDLSQAINAASQLGVLVVASAGNSGDKPYIVATGSSARSALSVAQTQVPSASLQLLEVAGVDYRAVFMPFSTPLELELSGTVQYGDGQDGNLKGCDDFAPGSLNNKIVLVDRGDCNFSLKISKVTEAGGLACIISRVDLGDPFPGGDGGDRPIGIPGYMISKADADAIRAAGSDTIATLDPDNIRPLVGTMAGSSSRGPQHEDTSLIKPEIGAPGSVVAAVAGSGSGTAPFGGTSGASPVVAGSAALILDKYPDLEPHEVKARLMNNCETDIYTDPFEGLAPITRIGGGEVRVDRALAARCAAWDEITQQGALSFGFVDVFQKRRIEFKRIRIRNYSDDDITYSVTPTFRYSEQEDLGAVVLQTLYPTILVPAQQDVDVPVFLTIKGDLLTGNYMSSGEEGGSGDALTRNEYDGYIVLDDGVQPLNVPWHIIPRKASNVATVNGSAGFSLLNVGVGEAQIEAFSLLALSENIPEGGPGEGLPTPDIRAVGIRTRGDDAGECLEPNSFIWDFAVSTWERQQHLAAVAFKIFIDIDQDGEDDYLVLNNDISGQPSASDGRQGVFALDLNMGDFTSGFYVEHAMNTGNIVLSVCSHQIGLSNNDLLSTSVNLEVYTQDILYSGEGDEVLNLTVTPGAERYVVSIQDVAPGQTGAVTVSDSGTFDGNSRELGVMIITDGDRGEGERGGSTQASELILLQL